MYIDSARERNGGGGAGGGFGGSQAGTPGTGAAASYLLAHTHFFAVQLSATACSAAASWSILRIGCNRWALTTCNLTRRDFLHPLSATHADTQGPEPITPHLRSNSPVSHNVTRLFRVLHLAAGRETDGTTIFVKGFSREFGGEDEVRQALTEAFADCGEVSQVNGFFFGKM